MRPREAANILKRMAEILSIKMHKHSEARDALLEASADQFCDLDDIYARLAKLCEHRLGDYAAARAFYERTSVDLGHYHRFLLAHSPEDKSTVRFVRSRVWVSPLSTELDQAILAEDIDFNMNAAHFHYTQALLDRSLAVDRALIHFSFGRFLRNRRKDNLQARVQFEAALAIDPAFCECHLNLAQLLMELPSEGERAQIHLQRVIDINAAHPLALQLLSMLQQSQQAL